jgi:hypothetical protein
MPDRVARNRAQTRYWKNPMTRMHCLLLMVGPMLMLSSMARGSEGKPALSQDRPAVHHAGVRLAADDQKKEEKDKPTADQLLQPRGGPGPVPPGEGPSVKKKKGISNPNK